MFDEAYAQTRKGSSGKDDEGGDEPEPTPEPEPEPESTPVEPE